MNIYQIQVGKKKKPKPKPQTNKNPNTWSLTFWPQCEKKVLHNTQTQAI